MFTSLKSVIQDFKLARYNSWLEDVNTKAKDGGLQLRLEKTLLRRANDPSSTQAATLNNTLNNAATGGEQGTGTVKAGSEIICNFDEDLLCLFSEVSYWEKFQGEFQIPYVVSCYDMGYLEGTNISVYRLTISATRRSSCGLCERMSCWLFVRTITSSVKSIPKKGVCSSIIFVNWTVEFLRE